MVLPLSDEPNPPSIPWANYALLAANVAVYLFVTLPLSATPADPTSPVFAEYIEVLRRQLRGRVPLQEILQHLSAYDLFVYLHGYKPAAPELSDLFTSMFLHANFLHLFGNMLFLWIYGDNVEHRLGHLRFLLWYLLTGVAATLFHAFFFSSSYLPLVGASGAISGVLGFYFWWFPYNRVRLLLLIFPFFMNVVFLPARLVLGFYLIIDNILPFLITYGSDGTGVAFGAHIGGFLAGLAAAVWFDRRDFERLPRSLARKAEVAGAADAARVTEAIRERRMAEAAGLVFRLDPKELRALSPADVLMLAEWLVENRQPRAALGVLQRVLRADPNSPAAPMLHLAAGEIFLRGLDEPALAYTHVVEALRSQPDEATETRARLLLREIARRQKLQVGRPRPGRQLDAGR